MDVSYSTRSLRLYDEIGSGSSSVVWKCQFNEKVLAAKVIEVTTWGKSAIFECMIMASFDSPYINSAEQILTDRDRVVILNELASSDLLSLAENIHIPVELIERYIKDLLVALYSFHFHSIIHGDVKARNILVYRNNSIKLTDFTLSRYGWSNPSDEAYTITHRPPEIWRKQTWSYSADIWALGCVIHEMVTGKSLFPFQEKSKMHKTILCSEKQGHILPPIFSRPEYKRVRQILFDCLTFDPFERPSADMILLKHFHKVKRHTVKMRPTYELTRDICTEMLKFDLPHEISHGARTLLTRLEPVYHQNFTPAAIYLIKKLFYQLDSLSGTSYHDELKLCHLLDFHLYVSL